MLRHSLWLMPLMLGICLMAWCLYHPLTGCGREFLALMFIMFSVLGYLFIKYDRANLDYTPEYHVISKVEDL